MAALQFTFMVACILCLWRESFAHNNCRHGDVKNRCEALDDCSPDDMCHNCECNQDVWQCEDKACTPDFEYLDLGTYGDSRYFFSMRARNWDGAKTACQAEGGNLAILETQNEKTALNALVDKSPMYAQSNDIYIGAHSGQADDGPWHWADNSILLRNDPKWGGIGGPDAAIGEGPHCAILSPWFVNPVHKSSWWTERCIYENYYICEKPKDTEVQ